MMMKLKMEYNKFNAEPFAPDPTKKSVATALKISVKQASL